jgi:hypothetical protein
MRVDNPKIARCFENPTHINGIGIIPSTAAVFTAIQGFGVRVAMLPEEEDDGSGHYLRWDREVELIPVDLYESRGLAEAAAQSIKNAVGLDYALADLRRNAETVLREASIQKPVAVDSPHYPYRLITAGRNP